MKTFATAGIIAAASAINTEATTTTAISASSFFDASRFYSYGSAGYSYPEFDHKEELTPVKKHFKKARAYKTNNIDIFAHSDSDESDHHDDHRSHHDSHSSHSDDENKHHKEHHVFLTGEGPEGDHCHEGDWCGDEYTSSDYSDSDY